MLLILKKYKKEGTFIFLEPIQSCLLSENSELYLKFLSNYFKKNNILLLLNEIITVLRIDGNSIQNKLNLHSDISTFRKVFGNGLPISFIAVSNKVYDKMKKIYILERRILVIL